MKLLKKVLALTLAGISAFSLIGCSSGGSSGGKTEVKITSYWGGFGTKWLDEAAARFEAENSNVRIKINHTKNTNVSTINSSGQDIYFATEGQLPQNLAQSGYLADINDIVTEKFDTRDGNAISIEDKIDENYRPMLKGNTKDGQQHYFALPYATYSTGISFDKDFFKKNKCYIAADGETNVYGYSAYGTTVNFITSDSAKKSVGQDGVENTEDDGLPVSMQEFLVLCHYIKNECNGASPIHYAGGQENYINGLINSLEISLGGYDYSQSLLTLTGDVKCVTMNKVSNEMQVQTTGTDIFSNSSSGAKVPETYTATLSDEKAHLTTQTEARYYANAFLYTLYKDGYFSTKSTGKSNNLEGQAEFLKSGYGAAETFAMFIEGSYWYTEAVENEMTSNLDTVSNIGWMPLPITLYKADSTEGKQSVVLVDGNSFAFINANTERNKPKVLEVAKKFLQFLYSDAELSKYTGSSGCYKRAMTYTVKEEDMAKVSSFSKNVLSSFANSKFVQFASSNKTVISYSKDMWGSTSRKVMPEVRETPDSVGTEHISTIMRCFRENLSLEKVYNSTVLESSHFIAK